MLTKNDLVIALALAVDNDITMRAARLALDRLLAAIETELASAGGAVNIAGFGKLSVTYRAERQARNPSTGEPITVPAHRVVKFAAGSALRDRLNPPAGTTAASVQRRSDDAEESEHERV